MDGAVAVVRVEVDASQDADPETVAEDVLRLQDELSQLDVESVERPAAGPAPAGAKGLAESIGPLVVTLSNSAVLVALTGVLRSWVSRDRGRKVTVRIGDDTLDVSRASEQEQSQLIEAWLDRHVGP